jgi:O-antigen/teichoic acid export membrane protein
VVALVPVVLLVVFASINRGVIQGEQRFITQSTLLILDAAVRVTCAVALISVGVGATGAVLALGIGLAASYAASVPQVRALLSGPVDQFDTRHIFRFAGPVAAAILGITFLYTVDVLLVKHFFDSQLSGIYGSVSTLGKMIFMVTASITGAMFPRVTSLQAQGASGSRTLLVSVGAIALVASGFLAVFVLAPSFVLLPFGPQFEAAGQYLPVFGTAMCLFAIANLLVNYLLAMEDNRFVVVLPAAAISEVLAIWAFHADLWQVIWSILAVGGATVAGLSFLCLTRRNLR